MMLTIGVCTL